MDRRQKLYKNEMKMKLEGIRLDKNHPESMQENVHVRYNRKGIEKIKISKKRNKGIANNKKPVHL